MDNGECTSEAGRGNEATNLPGVSVPAKDSSSSNPPPDPDATLVDFTLSSLDPSPADPDATMVDAGPVRPIPVRAKATGPGPVPLQTSAPVLHTGDVLGGRYEILKMLGEGGMGAVYKAKDRELDRPVALKVIRPELAANPPFWRASSRNCSLPPGHAQERDSHLRPGRSRGREVHHHGVRRGARPALPDPGKKKFAPEEAVEIIQQVCRALEAAHSVGVIHRDLKPQNIMLDHSGRVLVMDFGLARTLEGDGMTQTGALVGTMEYMSPEQALAKESRPAVGYFQRRA